MDLGLPASPYHTTNNEAHTPSTRSELEAARALLAPHNFRIEREIGRGTFARVYAAVCNERCASNAPSFRAHCSPLI